MSELIKQATVIVDTVTEYPDLDPPVTNVFCYYHADATNASWTDIFGRQRSLPPQTRVNIGMDLPGINWHMKPGDTLTIAHNAK